MDARLLAPTGLLKPVPGDVTCLDGPDEPRRNRRGWSSRPEIDRIPVSQ